MKTCSSIIISLLCIMALMTSCTMERRTYMPGYHTEWKKKEKVKDDIHCPVEGKSKADLEDDENYVKAPVAVIKDSVPHTQLGMTEKPKPQAHDSSTVVKDIPEPEETDDEGFEEENLVKGNVFTSKKKVTSKAIVHPKAIASFIFGWLIFIPYIGILFLILSLALGSAAMKEIRKAPQLYRGESLVRAGRIPIILVCVAIVIGLVALLAFIAAF